MKKMIPLSFITLSILFFNLNANNSRVLFIDEKKQLQTHMKLYNAADSMKIYKQGNVNNSKCWVEVTKNGQKYVSKKVPIYPNNFQKKPLEKCLSRRESAKLLSSFNP